MKKVLLGLLALALVVGGIFAWSLFRRGGMASALDSLQTETVRRSDLSITVEADGVVRPKQTALLIWKTSGTVDQVDVAVGDPVSAGQELASLAPTSLPQYMILAQVELIQAQRTLENLLQSRSQTAQALKAVEEARWALEDGQDPDSAQAEVLEALAQTRKAVEQAERMVYILTTPPAQSAIDQANTSLRQAENALNKTLADIERYERQASKNPKSYMFWESRSLYRKILDNLELKRIQDQKRYDQALNRYNELLAPPDPNDVALAEADLTLAQSQLAQSEREWERIKAGASPGDLAVLEARLADAEREWERLKDGPSPQDIAAAEARLAAAQAILDQASIRAPFDGVITLADTNPGDQVTPGTLAFRLDNIASMLTDIVVSEVDISRIQVGQPVVLRFDGIPGVEYHGEVVDIPAVGEVFNGIANFRVGIAISDADRSVRPGMTTTTTIEVSLLEDKLLVPNQALRFQDGQRVVFVLRDGQPVPVNVTLGASSQAYSQVLSGDLREGDVVLLEVPDGLMGGRAGLFRPRILLRVQQ